MTKTRTNKDTDKQANRDIDKQLRHKQTTAHKKNRARLQYNANINSLISEDGIMSTTVKLVAKLYDEVF